MDLRDQEASCLCLQNRPLGSKCFPAPGAAQLCVLSNHTGHQKHHSSLIFSSVAESAPCTRFHLKQV